MNSLFQIQNNSARSDDYSPPSFVIQYTIIFHLYQ